jgi:hypothetical protein
VVSGGRDYSTVERLELGSIAIQKIGEHPFGLGWGSFEGPAPGPYRYPHNLALEALVEAGWLSGLALIGWIAATWWRSRRGAIAAAGICAFALLTFTLVNSLVSGDINDNRALFLAIGICIALRTCKPLVCGDPPSPTHLEIRDLSRNKRPSTACGGCSPNPSNSESIPRRRCRVGTSIPQL